MMLCLRSFAQEIIHNEFARVDVCGANESLFSDAKSFYSKLGGTSNDDVEYISNRIFGVPEGKYATPYAVNSTLNGVPRMFLITRLSNTKASNERFLICALYPYETLKGFLFAETTSEGWIQGKRRFDIWQKSQGQWKVVLGVNFPSLNDDENSTDNSWISSDTLEEAVERTRKLLKSQKETSDALEKSMLKNLKKK